MNNSKENKEYMIRAAISCLKLMKNDALDFIKEVKHREEMAANPSIIDFASGFYLKNLHFSMVQLFYRDTDGAIDGFEEVIELIDEVLTSFELAGFTIKDLENNEIESQGSQLDWPLECSIYSLEDGDHEFVDEFKRISAYTIYGLCYFIENEIFDPNNQIPCDEQKEWEKYLKKFAKKKQSYFKALAKLGLALAEPVWIVNYIPESQQKNEVQK